MKIYTGKGTYGAIAIGKISLHRKHEENVRRIHIENAEAEKARYDEAREVSTGQLKKIYEKALSEIGKLHADIFQIHQMLLEDDDYNGSVYNIIDSQMVNAEYAVALTADNFSRMFASMEDEYIKARSADVCDISNRIIDNLTGNPAVRIAEGKNAIICAEDLPPSETVALDRKKVLAFVTAHGSYNSHTAILARNMNIPAVVGVGDDFLNEIKDGAEIIVDGFTGEVYVNPDAETLDELYEKQQAEAEKKRLFQELKGKENVTKDGTKIDIFANIGSTDNIGAVLLNDAGGIGLFRSDFLYMDSSSFPTEEQQFKTYKKILESMAGKKVVIRTLDIGAEKQGDYYNLRKEEPKEETSALGCRGVSLTRPDVFRTHLRALYRASAFGKLGIMFPLITSVQEVEKILKMCNEVKAELTAEGIEYSPDVAIGIMIDTPASAIISDMLAPMVDFFSVGTNDLTRYTLACDRQNPNAEQFMDPHHEAVLRLIELSAKNAHEGGARMCICGELAADTTLTERFLRMGIDQLSVSPQLVLKIRDVVRSIDLSK